MYCILADSAFPIILCTWSLVNTCSLSLTFLVVLFVLIPTACYAVIMIVLNILHMVDGPYPYLRVYNQPVYMSVLWCFIILGGAYAIARILLFLNRRIMKGEKNDCI